MKRSCIAPLLLAVAASCSGSPEQVTSTQYVYPAATNWAAAVGGPETGDIGVRYWVPAGRTVTLYKVSAESRLKVTISDAYRSGLNTNGGRGYYEVRVNGGVMSPRCYQGRYQANTAAWASGDFHHPYATVCVTDPLPPGLYEFDVWVQAADGAAYVGWQAGSPLIIAEELPTDGSYAISSLPAAGEVFELETSATTYTKAPLREVAYKKRSASSLLKVTLSDTLRTGLNVPGGSGAVMVRMDGADTSCFQGKYDLQGAIGVDLADPFVMTCVLANVAAGDHTFDVAIKSVTEGAGGGAADIGALRSYPLLLVEELSTTGRSFVAVTGQGSTPKTGELGTATWTQVGSRSVTHTVRSDGTDLKVTYSDNFRAAVNCLWDAGYLAIHLDGKATSCSLGQYSSLNSTPQNHHRPINLTCVFRDLAAGDHLLEVYSSAPCGSNMFGWSTGQSLLLAEELR